MDRSAEKEKKKYERLWTSFPEYGQSSSVFLAEIFLRYFKDRLKKGDRLIDFGCGNGVAAFSWLEAGLKVSLIDFCENALCPDMFLSTVSPQPQVQFHHECLWSLSSAVKPADWLCCFDVLEHIPENRMGAVLEAMSLRMEKGGLINIALSEDRWGKTIGEKLHLTVKSYEWWEKRILRYFSIEANLYRDEDVVLLTVGPKKN